MIIKLLKCLITQAKTARIKSFQNKQIEDYEKDTAPRLYRSGSDPTELDLWFKMNSQ